MARRGGAGDCCRSIPSALQPEALAGGSGSTAASRAGSRPVPVAGQLRAAGGGHREDHVPRATLRRKAFIALASAAGG